MGVVGGEVRPGLGQPLRHQHPARHGACRLRVVELLVGTGRDPDVGVVLDGCPVAPTHMLSVSLRECVCVGLW